VEGNTLEGEEMSRKIGRNAPKSAPEEHHGESRARTAVRGKNTATRDALIEKYSQFVEVVVVRLVHSMRLPLSSRDEFISAGFLGLIEAASRYDATRSPDFRAYAYLRIRGAIIDYIRSSCNLRGNAYRRFRVLEAAQLMREADLEGRRPSQAEKLAQAKASIQYLEKVAVSYAMSADGVADIGDDDDQIRLNPEARLQRKQRLEKIRSIVATLPEKERTIIEQYYFCDRKFVDVAEQYAGLSKSWVSRLHDRALDMLREKMLEAIEEIAA